jgi:hypothetical protein
MKELVSSPTFTVCICLPVVVLILVIAAALFATNRTPKHTPEPPTPQPSQPAILTPHTCAFRDEEVRKTRLRNEAREVAETVNGWMDDQAGGNLLAGDRKPQKMG